MNHDNYPDSTIRGILNTVKTIAMVGISPKDNRPSYFAFKYLLERGYHMIPVNPGQAGKEILGQKVYARLADIPEPIDMVDIFRASQFAVGVVEEALALKPKPARDLDAARRAQRRGRRHRRSRRPQGGDEPLPEDRIRPAVLRDRLDGRELPHTLSSKKAQLLGKGMQRMSLNRADRRRRRDRRGGPRRRAETRRSARFVPSEAPDEVLTFDVRLHAGVDRVRRTRQRTPREPRHGRRS